MEAPKNHLSSNLPMQTPTTRSPELYLSELSPPEGTQFPQHANQMYISLSTTPHVNQQIEHNSARTHMQMPEPLPTTFSPQGARETLDDVTSASHSPYQQGLYGAYWDSRTAFNPSWTSWPHPSDRYSFAHRIGQDIHGSRDQFLDDSGVYQSLSHTAHPHYPNASNDSDQNVADPPFIPPTHPLPQPSNPTLPHWHLRPTSSGYPEPGFGFRFALPQESPASSHRRRGARAIEHGGLWLDEEELFEGLKEPDGKLRVHRCLWEENRSPCQLWVKCDKSCINAHIQKWHGGKPGGDKLEVDCHWSVCKKTMLKESIARHVLSVHLGEMWECRGCEKRVTRKDAFGRHAVDSECLTAGALITYSVDVREIDARAALDSGGRLRYADA